MGIHIGHLIKTEFDRLIMPLNGASSSKSSFKKKEVEAVALSLDVLREDEKNLCFDTRGVCHWLRWV